MHRVTQFYVEHKRVMYFVSTKTTLHLLAQTSMKSPFDEFTQNIGQRTSYLTSTPTALNLTVSMYDAQRKGNSIGYHDAIVTLGA